VRIMIKTVFAFMFVLFISPQIYSKCLPRDESYKKYVVKSSFARSYEENEKAVKLLKKHLECWKDEEVLLKLAKIYIKMDDLWLII